MALGKHPTTETVLTKSQKAAVEHPLAPLMIIAGAGTGKTFTLVSRVAHLIRKHDIAPAKVLALTFSEQAAAELKGRILAMGGDGLTADTDEITAVTFHSFCYQIVLEFLPSFEGKRLMNSGDGPFMLREHFGELVGLQSEIFRQDPYRAIKAFLKFSNRLREELIDIDQLPKLLAQSAKDIEIRGEVDWEEEVAQLTDQCLVFGHYQTWKEEENWIDFGDMVYSCWQLLEQNLEVRKTVQDRFETIVVDEFQDNNYGLNKVVDLIARTHQSVTAVGDDDQCIYSFRGASVFNLSDFRERYGQHPQFREVVLDINYRSNQPILDMANEVMRVSPGRQEKMLHAHSVDRGAPIPTLRVGSTDSQKTFVAEEITRLVDEGLTYVDIAILTRTHKHGTEMVEALKLADIPIIYSRATFFELPAIRKTLAWCNIIGQSPVAAIGLYRLARDVVPEIDKGLFRSLWKIVEDRGAGIVPSDSLMEQLPDTLRTLVHQISTVIASSADMRLTQLIWRIMEINGLFRVHERKGFYEDELATRNLVKFIDLASTFDERYGRPDLARFLRYIDVLQGTDAITATVPQIDLPNGGVQIMTVHAAKGREFPVVILPFMQSARFPMNFRPDKEISSPPDEWYSWQLADRLDAKSEHIEEERRLFYVGVTRAEQQLLLTTTPKRRSKFVMNLKEGTMDEKTIPIDESESLNPEEDSDAHLRTDLHRRLQRELGRKAYLRAHETIEALELMDAFEAGATPDFSEHPLADMLRDVFTPDPKAAPNETLPLPTRTPLKLSASSIDTYETCPLKYRYRHLDKIPSRAESSAASFGTIVHKALEALHDPDGLGFDQPVSEILDSVWKSAGFSYEQEELVHKEEAAVLLSEYVDRWKVAPPATVSVEEAFEFDLDGVTIDGRIDRVDLDSSGKLTLVDYKTSRKARSERDARKAPQLTLYALYVQQSAAIAGQPYTGDAADIDLIYYYIRDENPEVIIHYSAEELQEFRERVGAVASGIRQRQFPSIKNAHTCNYCEFKSLLCPEWEQTEV